MSKNKNKNQLITISPNLFQEFFQGLKLASTNLWRNKSLSLATIFVVGIMICIFNSILIVNMISRQALSNLNQKVDLILYLQDNISYYDAISLTEQVKQIPGVKNVEYISKNEALKEISKTYPNTTNFLHKFNIQNPLPPSLSITTKKAETFQNIINAIKNSPYKNEIVIPKSSQSRNEQAILSNTAINLININNFVNQLIFWVIFIFIIGGSLIIISSIQLTIYTRREEIYIMRLVGATPFFIRLPFLIEASFYAIFAVITSFILLAIAGYFLGTSNFQYLQTLQNFSLIKFFFQELLITIILSLIGSFVTVDHHLKSKLISP